MEPGQPNRAGDWRRRRRPGSASGRRAGDVVVIAGNRSAARPISQLAGAILLLARNIINIIYSTCVPRLGVSSDLLFSTCECFGELLLLLLLLEQINRSEMLPVPDDENAAVAVADDDDPRPFFGLKSKISSAAAVAAQYQP